MRKSRFVDEQVVGILCKEDREPVAKVLRRLRQPETKNAPLTTLVTHPRLGTPSPRPSNHSARAQT